ncbi:GroES-like protein [Cucurbitaria berberidis CBS 394.84]|uniref:GroES-like protein n=1 Tax=Cucurbitaria berberidis CBS 394.84 TaxID=1168544 RepID=A0A9P4L375_9PLEO|nr:GroES-like protein [Cucurbitaria berberidis CBS 394.84]KAF1840050.1 GroES-like protein [Cucurbitaria berberidis CBS 394.84]
MSTALPTTNTSPTPSQPGRWIVTKFGTPSVLKWETFDFNSELSDDKVLVRIIVAGIAGVDNIQRAGGYPHPIAREPGFTTGYDLVGEVITLGDSVPKESGLTIGDWVTSLSMFGAHATHIVLPHTNLIKINRTDDPVKITALPLNYMTAWGMLKHSGVHLPPGSSILIGSASGGLGTAVAQLVTSFNMNIQMIGTCSPSKFDYLRSLGVAPIDRNAPDIAEQVRGLTNGEGVDVAYDGLCSEESLQKSLAATKNDVGKVIVFGVMGEIAADGSRMHRDVEDFLGERTQSLPRTSFYQLDTGYAKNNGLEDLYAIMDKVRSGKLEPVVAKLLRLSEAVKAHELLIDGSVVKGKMLFLVDADLAARYGI